MWYEADIDAVMKRTASRPIPAGRVAPNEALAFAAALSGGSVSIMGLAVGWLAAALLAFSIFFYAVVYTVWLKRATPQNIVIGGAAGAFPPVIGWAAVTGDVTLMPVILFAIIFLWTPPHFWALALFMEADYSKAGVPMLPVTNGFAHTRSQILVYSALLAPVSVAPALLGLTGWVYGGTALALGAIFMALAIKVARSRVTLPREMLAEKQLFKFSLLYLACLFGALVADRLFLT
jgi:protoheme IX farnesyltransferase